MNSGAGRRRVVWGALALAGWVAAGAWLAGWPVADESRPLPAGARIGQPLPPLALEGLHGGTVRPEDWRGRAVVLNFWATWCGPCREEMPALERLARELDPARAVVVGVALDEDRNLVREFALQFGISFPLAMDPGGRTVHEPLGVWALPDTLILTPAGRIADRVRGAADWDAESLRQRVRAAQGGPAVAASDPRARPAPSP
jgi:thiol-disulfide isomerase/thioredoxin